MIILNEVWSRINFGVAKEMGVPGEGTSASEMVLPPANVGAGIQYHYKRMYKSNSNARNCQIIKKREKLSKSY